MRRQSWMEEWENDGRMVDFKLDVTTILEIPGMIEHVSLAKDGTK